MCLGFFLVSGLFCFFFFGGGASIFLFFKVSDFFFVFFFWGGGGTKTVFFGVSDLLGWLLVFGWLFGLFFVSFWGGSVFFPQTVATLKGFLR